ncbi:M43 family zinc metalloprotease [Algoriphagus namhaensis]|uniref:M43 family zinc metalloprotease n=1 Tax=Algoriphagus namhaensis TaxID=915353 RepID=A0ABV8AVN1_9BACT
MIKSLKCHLTVFLLLFGTVFISSELFAQEFTVKSIDSSSIHQHVGGEKCGHGILEARLEKQVGYFASKPYFESWIDKKIESRRNSPQVLSRTQNDPIRIPVVVHIIHSGTTLGQGSNIPDSQVFEQIRVLNEDFNRTNADASRTPTEFLPVAGSANIEFVLARQDEQGLPTTGIVRVQGPKSTYSPDDATLIGQTSQWNPEEYLNIWVVPLVQPFIGYASFPISDLPGLNFAPTSVITDGVTVDYRFFGVGGNAVGSSLGRTATHEVGHYLGLRHIWGDGGCGVDDFVEDTPPQDNSNNSCNSNPSRFSCGTNDMIQNYMDYTPDACMNIFTLGQIERFHVVLENSPRRTTLVNNRATEDPVLPDFDLGILRVIQPSDFACEPLIQPAIEVLNAGEQRLTSARIQLLVNGVMAENKNVTFNLETGDSEEIIFNEVALPQESNQVIFRITSVNGVADQNPDNNEAITNPVIQGNIELPYALDLAQFPEQWVVDNPDGEITWSDTQVTINGQTQDAVVINHYDYEAQGQLDYFISPKIDLTRYPNAQLVFEVAYGPYAQSGFQDRLLVAVSPDCGGSFDINSATYNKFGTRLETSQPTLDEFVPTDASQFRTELFNLNEFADLGSVRLAIVTQNGYGNNLYLKNIRILPNEEFNYKAEIINLVLPSPIVDGTQTQERVSIKNTGNLPLTSFLFSRSTNGSQVETFVASGSTLMPGDTTNLVGMRTTRTGKNRMDFTLFDPNFDMNGNNSNSLVRYIIEDAQTISSPWRQNFNNPGVLSSWNTLNPETDGPAWRTQATSSGEGPNNVLVFDSPVAGNSYWIASPIFDLSSRSQASLFFDLAAGEVSGTTKLQLLASENGGESYVEVWSASGTELSTVGVGASNPNTIGDFARKYVNLSDFAGTGKTEVRLAFALSGVSASDSPIYLDNLELFLSANPNPVIPAEGRTVLFPNPASDFFNLAFNLSSFETVNIQIISSSGALIQDIDYPQTLNQTYTFATELFGPGVYVIKITSDTVRETKRLIIN